MFEYRPVPKPKRRKRKKQNRFNRKVRKKIKERDNNQCVRCGKKAHHIHHIIFLSQGGKSNEDNGVCVCIACHQEAHEKREVRKWFEEYRKKYLL